MKFCTRCGSQIDESAIFCPKCGQQQGQGFTYQYQQPFYNAPTYTAEDLAPSRGFAVLSFLFPIVGLVLWIVWKNTKPGKAESCAKGALASTCVGTPFIGLILWAVWRRSFPSLARVCGISAIIGAIIVVLFYALIIVLAVNDVLPEEFFEYYYGGYYDFYNFDDLGNDGGYNGLFAAAEPLCNKG